MSLSPLLPIAGGALTVVADRAIDAVKGGLSFLDVLRQQPNTEAASPKPVAHTDPTQLLEGLLEHFQRLGINTDAPVRLKSDGDGGVIIDGEHPDRVLIESLFNSHDELTAQFRELATAAVEQDKEERRHPDDFRITIDGPGAAIGFA